MFFHMVALFLLLSTCKTAAQSNHTMYAFSAYVSVGEITVADGSNIVFDQEITNVGGLYFKDSGQFVCLDDDIYVFMWSISKSTETAEGMQCITSLKQGGQNRKYGPKTSYYSTTYSGTTEMMAVIQCEQATAVTIISEPWSDSIPGCVYRFNRTAFSGFKLQSAIGFTVELSKDIYINDGSRVPFDNVLVNFGEHYDALNGFFRCPDDELYVFSVSTHTTDPSTPWSVSRLMKQGAVVMQGPITYIARSAYDSGSNSITAVVQCSTAQSIYVETQTAHDFPYNSYAPNLSSFTGFKLYDPTDISAIAFTAIMSENQTATFDGQVFMYDHVITNIGGAFDPVQSSFICPDDGYYVFTWTSTSNIGGNRVELYIDNSRINHVHPTTQTSDAKSGTSGSATLSVIQQCAATSQVQLRALTAGSRVYLGGYNSFSGYRVPGDWTPQK